MTMSLIACGKTEPVTENDSTDTTVNTTDDTSTVVEENNEDVLTNETVEDTVTVDVPEEQEEPVLTEEEIKAQKIEAGMEKVQRLLDAYLYLANGTIYDRTIQWNIEYLDAAMGGYELENYTTKDGLKPVEYTETERGVWSVGIVYYDSVVNGGNEPYDLAEWVVKQESNKAIIQYIPGFYELNKEWTTNDILLMEAIGLCPYLNSKKEIRPKSLFDTTGYTISGMKSSYAIILDCDGNYDLTAVFDEEGNMLNICTPIEWDEYLYTWY